MPESSEPAEPGAPSDPPGRSAAAEGRGGVLRNRSYRNLFIAASISNYGSMLSAMALPFVAIAVLDASPADIASLTAAGLLPGFLLGWVASAWVDRLSRRRLLVASDWASALLVLWIPLAAWQGWLDLVQLHVVVALHGLFVFLFGAAHHAILPAIVRTDQLIEANGRLKAAESVSEGAAFASGGWLIQWLGAPFVFLVDSLSYAMSALWLRGVEAHEPEARGRDGAQGSSSVFQEAREGLRFLLGQRLLGPTTLALALVAMSWRIAGVVYLLYVYEELGFSPGVLGLIFAAGGVASLLGAIAAERYTPRLGVGRAMIVGVIGFGLTTLALPLAPGVGALGLLCLVLHQLGDGFEVLFEVNQASLRQTVTPSALMGRVAGAGGFAAAGAMLAGLALGGWLGEWLGLRATLVAAGVTGLLGAGVLWVSPVREVRTLGEA